jgi:hypothetical protein
MSSRRLPENVDILPGAVASRASLSIFSCNSLYFSLPDNLDQLIKKPLESLQAHVYIQLVSDSAQSVLHGLY